MKYGFLYFLLMLLLATSQLNAQMASQFTEDCVILFEKKVNDRFYPIGTGFLIQSETENKYPIVVTNKHLLTTTKVYISLPADKEILDYAVNKNITEFRIDNHIWKIEDKRIRTEFLTAGKNELNYVLHEDSLIDIAAFQLQLRRYIYLRDDSSIEPYGTSAMKGRIKCCNFAMVPRKLIGTKDDIRLGRDTYFLGFPMGFGAEDPISPILRSGAVAWMDPEGKEFWLDAVSMNGNSGSPVFIKPNREEQLDEQHTRLIGMIYAHWGQKISLYIPDENNKVPVEAIKEIENLGLARAVWADDILNVVQRAEEKIKPESSKSALLPQAP